MPAHRVLASLGDLPALEVENLRTALAASREGRAILLPEQLAARVEPRKVRANLVYLDIASLTVQRCVAPGSKLRAVRWYPKTALPELLDVAPTQFNNTRLHRVLEDLETIEEPLQHRLAQRIDARQGPFGCLFLDCTDTWFTGRGPALAHKGPTKEGLYRRRIGIALLCDPNGFPLRWATLSGNHYEANSMMELIGKVAKLSWAQGIPFVMDRAMGRGVTVATLSLSSVQFLTAIPVPEIAVYSKRIPLSAFDDVPLHGGDSHDAADWSALQRVAEALGFKHQSPRCYLLDLGVFVKGEGMEDGKNDQAAADLSRAVAALRVAKHLRAVLDASTASSIEVLAREYGCTVRTLRKWFSLLSLAPQLQARVLDGEADRVTPKTLEAIASLLQQEQPAAFDEACEAASDQSVLVPGRVLGQITGRLPVEVRGVVLFNPERFIKSTVSSSVTKGRTVHQLELTLDEKEWRRRRRTDGLTLLVAHPAVVGTAVDLAGRYFAKDKVEKDFQTIKSVTGLRPVRHRTDPKVRAHVTLCMLALLVQRTIEQKLHAADLCTTAQAALTAMASCHLNMYASDDGPVYSCTEPDQEQQRLLDAMGLQALGDDEAICRSIVPRGFCIYEDSVSGQYC